MSKSPCIVSSYDALLIRYFTVSIVEKTQAPFPDSGKELVCFPAGSPAGFPSGFPDGFPSGFPDGFPAGFHFSV